MRIEDLPADPHLEIEPEKSGKVCFNPVGREDDLGGFEMHVSHPRNTTSFCTQSNLYAG